MEWIAVTARTIRLPGSCCPMRQIEYQRQKRALVGMFVIMRQFIMRYGCAKFRMIIKMAMHMQMAFTIISHIHVHVHGYEYGYGGDTSARSIARQDIGSINWHPIPVKPDSDRSKPAQLTTEPRKAPKVQRHGQHPSKVRAALIHACRLGGFTFCVSN